MKYSVQLKNKCDFYTKDNDFVAIWSLQMPKRGNFWHLWRELNLYVNRRFLRATTLKEHDIERRKQERDN